MGTSKELTVPRIIWFAMLILVLSYFGILVAKFGMGSDPNAVTAITSDTELIDRARMNLILTCAAALLFLIGVLIPIKGKAATIGTPAPAINFPRFIFRIALFEAIALCGLYWAFTTQTATNALVFTVVAILGFLFSFPRAPVSPMS